MNRPGLEIGINKDPISIIWNIKQKLTHTNVTVSLRDEFNRDKETETSTNERIPKTDGRSMKYRNTGDGIISTFVKLSFLSMSVMRQIWKARRQFIVIYDFRLA